jgi:hypothetical protein
MLRYEDLEDCFGQASMELIRYVRAGGSFDHAGHAAAALELRFLSRIQDRCRALCGRSPIQAACERALAAGNLGDSYTDEADVRCAVEELAMMRLELRLVPILARALTPDQRLVVACQVALQMRRAEFCELFGWSHGKYRKVAHRARMRMRHLSETVDESKLDGDASQGAPVAGHSLDRPVTPKRATAAGGRAAPRSGPRSPKRSARRRRRDARRCGASRLCRGGAAAGAARERAARG